MKQEDTPEFIYGEKSYGAWTANEGIMLSGQITDVGMTLHQINADLSCTPGHSLPQVLTKPIWTLGADEPWAATWGVREDIAALAEEGREIRRRIFTDTAEPDDEKRLTEISQLTHGAVHKIGYDTTFDRFENGLLRLGERDEGQYAGITTSADLARLESLADQAIRTSFEM